MSINRDRYGVRSTDLRDKKLEENRDEYIAEINKKFKEGIMSKEFIITQEELDMLEAIRLNLYNLFAECGNVNDIIKISKVSEPLWKIINKKRDEVHS